MHNDGFADVTGPQPILPLAARALGFAVKAHAGQVRKYTGRPYIEHPIAVADIVRAVGGLPEMIAAAYLHDVMEDCGATYAQLLQLFGREVANLVRWLSDPETEDLELATKNRATRKAAAREHIRKAPPEAKTIKLADILDNTGSIEMHDPKFWRTYKEEKKLLMPCLIPGDVSLWHRAAIQCGFSN